MQDEWLHGYALLALRLDRLEGVNCNAIRMLR
jgi:hypothetical protein